MTHFEHTFRIEGRLGSGGCGKVYKAWHLRLQKHVVIKEYMRDLHDVSETRSNEVEALKNVKNTHLPQVLDFLSDGIRVCTVMEFIEGDSFDKLIGNGYGFTEEQVIKWYGQLASALTAIHKRDVCHRDIKPANVILTPGGDVCLIDFNSALVGERSSRLISRSLGYASPEQYKAFKRLGKARKEQHSGNTPCAFGTRVNEVETELIEDDCITVSTESGDAGLSMFSDAASPVPDTRLQHETLPGIDWKRSDIYSLAATMYHLLTGKRPHKRVEEAVTIPKPERLCEGLVYVIERSMRLDPTERFSSAEELTQALQDIQLKQVS